MKMYVWSPPSLADYSDGMVCAIAENKTSAIELAVAALYPYVSVKRGLTAAEKRAVLRTNQNINNQRLTFRDELKKLKPQVLSRGAVYMVGGS